MSNHAILEVFLPDRGRVARVGSSVTTQVTGKTPDVIGPPTTSRSAVAAAREQQRETRGCKNNSTWIISSVKFGE